MLNGKNNIEKHRPIRKKNEQVRSREYLTPDEMEKLLTAAKKTGRLAHRNYTAILLAYNHGLRNSELCNLRWESVDLNRGTIYITRLKGSVSGVHPLHRDEVRALHKLRKQFPQGEYLLQTQTGKPMSERSFHQIVQKAGILASIPLPCHPHMLRHSCGYYSIQKHDLRAVQSWLGHRQIQSTIGYTALAPGRFKGWWD